MDVGHPGLRAMRSWTFLILLATAGCGGVKELAPAEPDAAPAVCGAWTAPDLIPIVNSSALEVSPDLSSDGLSLYMARLTTSNNYDLFVATRVSTTSPFAAPRPLSFASDPVALEDEPHLSASGRELFFVRDERLWVVRRDSAEAPFGEPENLGIEGYSPSLSGDELTLYFTTGSRIILSARASEAGIALSVEDNGLGVAQEDLARIQEPFEHAGRGERGRH